MPNRDQHQKSKSHETRYRWCLTHATDPPRSLVAESHIQAFKQELDRLVTQQTIQVVEKKVGKDR